MKAILITLLTAIFFFNFAIGTILPQNPVLPTGWYYIVEKDNGIKRKLYKDSVYYFIDPKPIITAKNITNSKIYKIPGGILGLSMKLDEKGTAAWSEATQKSIGKHLAFIINDKLMHAPLVNSQIPSGMTALNRPDLTQQELEELQKLIEQK